MQSEAVTVEDIPLDKLGFLIASASVVQFMNETKRT
jgi:hypothetical protein